MRGKSLVASLIRCRRAGFRSYRTSSDAVSSLSESDVGHLYQVPLSTAEQLCMNKNLPSPVIKQMDTLGELALMLRRPLLEVSACMDAVRPSFPAIRAVLWGPFGTGKTVTINQAVHMAHEKQWVIISHRSAMELTRRVAEVEMSSYKPGRINDPVNAGAILQQFKQQNSHIWKTLAEMKTERQYEWTKAEKTAVDRPITDIVEMGLSAPFLASDCVGALFRELKRHASAGNVKVLVAVDDANSLWGKTLVKKADRSYANPSDLTLVNHFRGLLSGDWSNALVLLVADKKEVSDARDELTISRYTPMELFGEEGFDFIEPFIPIETGVYSAAEVSNMYDYYTDKRWISSANGRTEEGRQQMIHLSAFNPFFFERLAAFN